MSCEIPPLPEPPPPPLPLRPTTQMVGLTYSMGMGCREPEWVNDKYYMNPAVVVGIFVQKSIHVSVPCKELILAY